MSTPSSLHELRDALLQIQEQHRDSLLHFKRRWEESRGDEHDAWGASDWYFETAADGAVIRQMEIYDSGQVLQYHPRHLEDEFGRLAEHELSLEEFEAFAISGAEFEAAWHSHQPPTHKKGA